MSENVVLGIGFLATKKAAGVETAAYDLMLKHCDGVGYSLPTNSFR